MRGEGEKGVERGGGERVRRERREEGREGTERERERKGRNEGVRYSTKVPHSICLGESI